MTRRGFTLVEILVTALIAIAILGAAIQLLMGAVAFFQRSEAKLDPREASRAALAAVREQLIDALDAAVTADGKRLVFRRLTGTGEVGWDPAPGRLTLRAPGATVADTLIASGVAKFNARLLRPGYFQLALTLARPGVAGQNAGQLTAIDEVFVAAMGEADRGAPWHPIRDGEPRK